MNSHTWIRREDCDFRPGSALVGELCTGCHWDQTEPMIGQVNEILRQSIIHPVSLLQKRVGGLKQESAQRLWIGEDFETGQVLEGPVGT